jgi:hypothetical protein
MKRCFKVSMDVRTPFVLLGQRKRRLRRSRSSEDLSRRNAPWTHILPSGRFKKWFFRGRWSVVSRSRKAMCFLNPGVPKKRLGRFYLSDVLSRGMALRTHNLPSGRLKKWQLWSRWTDILRCRKAVGTHFLLPGHRKNRIWRRINYVLSRRLVLRTHNLPSGRLKTRFCRSRWNVVSRLLRTQLCFLGTEKSEMDEVS